MSVLQWCLIAVAALLVSGVLATVVSVGRPRKPITGGAAATTVVLNALILAVLVLSILAL